MKLNWILPAVALSIVACGGGGEGAKTDTATKSDAFTDL